MFESFCCAAFLYYMFYNTLFHSTVEFWLVEIGWLIFSNSTALTAVPAIIYHRFILMLLLFLAL